MIVAYLLSWLVRPAKRDTRTPAMVAVPALRTHQAPRRTPAVPAVKVSVNQIAREMVIRFEGEAGVESTGTLLAGLLAPSACRPAVVTLDLSELRSVSCLAMGVLVAYRRGVVRNGGRVRLAAELQPAVREALARAELLGLFEARPADNPQADPNSLDSSNLVAA
jgi:anti-anti-sigma factor